jgi:hypothetical protein
MKIIYIISTIASQNNGNGGHYYSLLSTATAIKQIHEVKVINIGTQKSFALLNSNLDIINITDSKLSNYKLLKDLYKTIKNDQADVIHAFDSLGYFYARIINIALKLPLILTKCGGSNPKYYYPYCKNFINYSIENVEFFKAKNKFKTANHYLIPNRTSPFENDETRIKKLKDKYNLENYDSVFLRIARIGYAYKNSILQLLNLVHECTKYNIKCCVLLIGTVEDNSILEEIKKYNTETLFIENDTYFTRNSKELIEIADVVLGTGRSFMEAALKQKIMLAPIIDQKFPILVKPENFNELFKTNFSERGRFSNFNDQKNLSDLIDLLSNKSKRDAFINETNNLYDYNFNIQEKLSVYDSIYKELKFNRSINFIDSFQNYLFVLKKFFQSKSSKIDQ